MKIQLVADGKNTDITQVITSVEWSGSASEAARRLTFGVVASPIDKNVPQVKINLGNTIIFSEDDELFRGFVFDRSKSYSGTEIEITAYDGLIYLTKSKGTYNIKKTTPEEMTNKLCSELGIPLGEVVKTGIKLDHKFDGISYFEILTTLYAEAGKQNGKRYKLLMKSGKLCAVEFGSETIDIGILNDARYADTIQNIVTQVKIYDEKGNQTGIVSDEAIEKSFGIVSDEYKAEKGKNSTVIAKGMLNGSEQSASIEVPGNSRCIAGKAVKVKDSYTGVSGRFWVASDTHKWAGGQHSMSLELSFKEVV